MVYLKERFANPILLSLPPLLDTLIVIDDFPLISIDRFLGETVGFIVYS